MSLHIQRLKEALSDPDRLSALERTQLIDSPPEIAFDRLTQLATRLTGAPLSLVSLVTDNNQFFKSTAGLPDELADLRTTPLSHSFCQHAVASGEQLVVDDTRTHQDVQNVQSIEDFGILSYLGIPLQTDSNHILGTLCILGYEPRNWTSAEIETVHDLASIAMTEIALRLELRNQVELKSEIREREKRYHSVLEGIQEVVFRLNERGDISFVNSAWKVMMGYDIPQTLGRPISKFLPRDEQLGDPFAALQAYANSQKPYTTHLITSTGEVRWLEVRVKRQSNQSRSLTGVITDVTNSYRVDAEREARQEAERHLKLRDALLSNLSHEIRTPITAIMSCSEILHHEVDQEQQEFTTMIREGGERLLSTLETMLLFAQVDSQNVDIKISTFNISQLAWQIIDARNPKHLSIKFEAAEALTIESDASFIRIILNSLVDNAIKFTPQGEVAIRLRASKQYLRIEIQDTGIGIPRDYIPNLFTPFEQVSTGYERKYEGCGLGLALTKLLVDLLKGRIWVESEENAGSTFYVELPRTISEA